jgi:hypothetical protein
MLHFAPVAALAGLALATMSSGVSAESQAEPQLHPPTRGQVQDVPPQASPDDGTRYSFHRIGDRFARLDSHTGQVAQCGWSATGWACNVVPDERAALESEVARIQKENAALKKLLLSRGIDLPDSVKPDVAMRKDEPPARKEPELNLPSDAELDRAIAFMKQVWRRLVEMMVDFQRDMQRKS